MKPSTRHRRDSDALIDFRDAFIDLINATTVTYPRGLLAAHTSAVPPEEWNGKRFAVATAAGSAGPAYRRNGSLFVLRNPAYTKSGFNPLANWEFTLESPTEFSPESLISSVEAAAALASERAKEAAEAERGVTGLIASFIRWPANLREAVGGGAAQRRAATTLGVFGQILVAVVSLVIATFVTAGVVALWHLVI